MQKKTFCKCSAMRFKHFSRKGYALFSCLGREVLIGTLSVATLTYAKAEGVSVREEISADTLLRTELKLDEVIVTGSRAPLTLAETAKIVSVITREDIHRAAAESINDILKLATGVDVRQRGGYGVQTDISVRGGNFDQITILLNGGNISSPHTGHLSADFPVSPEDIERIEILEGPAARVYGTSAFNGVINIVTAKSFQSNDGTSAGDLLGGYVKLDGGSYGYANGNASLSHNAAVGAGQFVGALSGGYTRSDGAVPNSNFTSSRVFYNGAYRSETVTVNGQVGYSYKPYAANTFYGASSTDQWESNERWMAAVNADVKLGNVHVMPHTFWNRWYDHYQWHKDNPAGENYHKVDCYGGGASAWFASVLGKTSIGLDIRRETIWSTKLGIKQDEWEVSGGHDGNDDILYKFYDGRTDLSAYFEHDILLNHWTISLGLLADRNTGLDHTWRFFPGVDIAYRPNDALKLYASWNKALRLPTFTDLYYSGANIEGNSNLKPEKTSDFQLGARYAAKAFTAELQLFYSHKTDMIDWTTYKEANDNIFHSVNFQMDNLGAELNLQFLPQQLWGETCPLRKIGAQYSYIHEDSEYDVTVITSKYAMDYLRHKVALNADARLYRKLNLGISWRWQDRIGENNPSYALLDAKISWDAKSFTLFANATNIFNRHYFDYVSVPQPGRQFHAGVILRF